MKFWQIPVGRSALIAALLSALPAVSAAEAYAPFPLQSLGYFVTTLSPGVDGNFYGIAGPGDSAATSSIIRFKQDGSVTQVLDLSLLWGKIGTAYLTSAVQGNDGSIYGTTSHVGTGDYDLLFKLTPQGQFVVLHRFSHVNETTGKNADGGDPRGLVRGADGNLYGVSNVGGPGGAGNIFKLSPAGSFSIVTHFSAPASSGGMYPFEVVQGADSSLYVMTEDGDVPPVGLPGGGVLSRVNADGSFSELHAGGPDEQGPQGFVQVADGSFYGAYNTSDYINPQGNSLEVFKLTPDGQFNVLPSLFVNNCDGTHLFTGNQGHVYGVCIGGGPFATMSGTGGGVLYQVTDNDEVEALNFLGYPGTTMETPTTAVIGSDGNLYGISGSAYESFELALPPPPGWGIGPTPTMTLAFDKPVLSLSKTRTATLGWTLTNTNACDLSSGESATVVTANGSTRVSFTTPGVYTYSLACGNNGTQAWSNATIVVKN